MKILLGKKLVSKVISKVMDVASFEDILEISKEVANVEEALFELAFSYYESNKQQVINKLCNISEDDMQKAHDLLVKVLSYTPKWDSELNLTITFEKE